MEIKRQIRATPQVGYAPYRQVHPHSTGNPNSTVQDEADNQTNNKPVAFFTHVVGNGQIVQIAEVGRGAYDVGGGWNYETYAAVELIESHANRAEFDRDYRLYVNLLRQLAKEAGIPCTLDTHDLAGIKTHMFCTYNQPGNASDHIDPYPYLNKWGITVDQFERDLAAGFENGITNTNTEKPKQPTNKRNGDKIMYLLEVVKKKSSNEVWFIDGESRSWLPSGQDVKDVQYLLESKGLDSGLVKFSEDNRTLKVLFKKKKEVKY